MNREEETMRKNKLSRELGLREVYEDANDGGS
jgi:hypothetical protein